MGKILTDVLDTPRTSRINQSSNKGVFDSESNPLN